MIIGKLLPYNYKLKLEKLWNEVSLDWMFENGCLIYEVNYQLIALIYNQYSYFSSAELFVSTTIKPNFYILNKEEWTKKYELLKLQGKERYNYSKYSEKFELPTLQEEIQINYTELDAAPIVQMVNIWIEKAIILGASDIHIEPRPNEVIIRIRLDGQLAEMDKIKKELFDEILVRIKIMSNLDITRRMLPQDGKFQYSINNKNYDLRVSTIPTILGEKIVIRILDKVILDDKFEKLNYTKEEEKMVRSILSEKSGMILITGTTGCGKTTTMYTYLSEIDKKSNNIMTIEDPVEYSLEGINQIQVNQKAGLTFAETLRSILRQDPNVIMIGEIRDEETAKMAMRAALSGHLVISTLHATSSVGAITRLLDMGIPRYLVSSALKLVICQQLVQKLCPKCKKTQIASDDVADELQIGKNTVIYEKGGCQYCFNTGYKGRFLLSEIVKIDDKIKNMILSCESEEKIAAYAKKQKTVFLKEKYRNAVVDGITDIVKI